MVSSDKGAFWQALIAALFIFGLGIVIGFLIEANRTTQVSLLLQHSEVNVLDEQLRGRLLTDLNVDCKTAQQSSFDFADNIYREAFRLERYDSASKFSDELQIAHRRYDLLRMYLWAESIKIRERCKSDFHTVVYLYNYSTTDLDIRAQQTAYARLLTDVKQKYPDSILLIPLAVDSDLASLDLTLATYDVLSTPSIIIDEQVVVDHLIPAEQLTAYIFSRNPHS